MARRTLVARTIEIKRWGTSGASSDHFLPLDDFDGKNLLTLFEQWLQKQDQSAFKDDAKKRYISNVRVISQPHAVFVEARIGYWGDPGREIVDINTHERRPLKEDEATTVPLRAALVVPPAGKSGLCFIEKEGHDQVGAELLLRFKGLLTDSWKSLPTTDRRNFIDTTTAPGKAWIETADLQKIGVSLKYKLDDMAENEDVGEVEALMTTTVRPERGKRTFGSQYKKDILEHGSDGLVRFGVRLPADYDGDPLVKVQLGDGHREKTFAVDDPKAPSLLRLLNDYGEHVLDTDTFAQVVCEEAGSYYQDVGRRWDTSWIVAEGLDELWSVADGQEASPE